MEKFSKLFMDELNALLVKYEANLSLGEINPRSWHPTEQIVVEFHDWNTEDVELGRYHDGEKNEDS